MFCKNTYINHFGLSLLAMVLALTVTVGCSDDLGNDVTPEAEAGYITLNLRNVKSPSRAADNENNEDRIASAVICLYRTNGTAPATTPAYVEKFDISKNETATVRIKLSKTLATQLFGDGNGTCGAYVVANLPEADANGITTDIPLESIRKITISSDFASMNPQASFVMDGTATVTRTNAGTSNDSAAGTIELTRSAARISLSVKVADSYTDASGDVWTPDASQMSVLITNGVSRSQVESSSFIPTTTDYYSTTTSADETHRQRPFNTGTDADYPNQLASPFYTYPNEWNPEDVESPMTYMTLMVPWKKNGEDRYRTCYYMVPVVRGNELVRNVAYSVKLSVNVLGSFTPDQPLVLDDLSYYAIDWGRLNIDASLDDSRYLVVDRNNYEVDNEDYISIPVYTSHSTVIRDIKMTYRRYNTSASGNEFPVEISKAVIDNSNSGSTTSDLCTYKFNNVTAGSEGASIEITHPLKIWEPYTSLNGTTPLTQEQLPNQLNNIVIYKPSNPLVNAYSRYTIEVTIQHEDMTGNNFLEVITIEQYPQMYIEAAQNHTGGSVTGTASNGDTHVFRKTDTPLYGNTYIDGNQSTSGYSWRSPSSLSGNNENPNMYIISTTQLDENTRYIIGDPRTESIQNPDYTFTDAPDMSGTTRTLLYYYPADENKDAYIAPKFRVASSWGKSYTMTKEDAIRRCASYQEKDCPAGRWRLPTRSELEYITNMSANDYIPLLFNLSDDDLDYRSQNGYWTAQGRIVQDPSQTGGILILSSQQEEASVRCVYDEWYWTDKVQPKGTIVDRSGWWDYTTDLPKYPFTWGDRQRTN